MLTDRQVTLIQNSFQKIIIEIDQTAYIFYQHLFELKPNMRHLFKEDLQIQGRKLIQMLLFIVNNLHNDHDIAEQLTSLGKRHVAYNVKTEYFDSVGETLLWTLEQQLGAHFTDELHEAWQALYDGMTDIMIEGMKHD